MSGTDGLSIVFRSADYIIPQGTTASITVVKPSGKQWQDTAAVDGNDVIVDINPQMVSELGISEAQVELKNNESTIYTFVYPLNVQKTLNEIDSETGSTIIDMYLDEMNEAISNANTATSSANTAADTANAAAAEAEKYVLGDISNKTVDFSEASARENIETGESTATLFGKIRKFFSDLKEVAFSGAYSDLTGSPDIANNLTTTQAGSILDARQGKTLNDNKLDKNNVANNLTTTGAGSALDARQGKILNDKIEEIKNEWTTFSEVEQPSEKITVNSDRPWGFTYNPFLNLLIMSGGFVTNNSISTSDVLGYLPEDIPKPTTNRVIPLGFFGYTTSGGVEFASPRAIEIGTDGAIKFRSSAVSGVTYTSQLTYCTAGWFA